MSSYKSDITHPESRWDSSTLPFLSGSCGSLSAVTTNVTSTCYTSVLTIPAVQALNGNSVQCTNGFTKSDIVGNDTVKIMSEYL